VQSNAVRALILVTHSRSCRALLRASAATLRNLPLRTYWLLYGGVANSIRRMMACAEVTDVLVATPGRPAGPCTDRTPQVLSLQVLSLDGADRSSTAVLQIELTDLCRRARTAADACCSPPFSRNSSLSGELLRDPLLIDISPPKH